MRNRHFYALMVTTLFLFASQAQSQTTLTWDQCVQEAKSNNLDIKVAEQAVKAAEDTHIASLGQWFPQISLGSTLERNGTDSTIGGALSDPNYTPTESIGISVQENLFSGFKDFAAVDLANAQLDNAKAKLTQAKAQLSHDLMVDFYTLLYNQQQVVLLDSIMKRDLANEQLVYMNFKGGTDNEGSYLIAKSAVEQDQYNLDAAKRSMRVNQEALDQVLGRNPFDEIKVSGAFEVPSLPKEEPDFIALTLETPSYLEALAQYHEAESQYVTARGDFFPTLTANASLGGSGYSYATMSAGWTATLNLSLPIFTGGTHLFNFKSAEESKQGSEKELESTALKTENSLESAYAAYANAIEENKIQDFEVHAAQTQEVIAKAEYLNGLLIFENWNQVEDSLTNQENSQLSSLLNTKTTQANWELTEGKGVIP